MSNYETGDKNAHKMKHLKEKQQQKISIYIVQGFTNMEICIHKCTSNNVIACVRVYIIQTH